MTTQFSNVSSQRMLLLENRFNPEEVKTLTFTLGLTLSMIQITYILYV